MIRKNVCCVGVKALVLMIVVKGGYQVHAQVDSKASKNGKSSSSFIPVAIQSPGNQANPCKGAGNDFLKLNGLSNGIQRDDGRTLLTCADAAANNQPQAGGVSITSKGPPLRFAPNIYRHLSNCFCLCPAS